VRSCAMLGRGFTGALDVWGRTSEGSTVPTAGNQASLYVFILGKAIRWWIRDGCFVSLG
jgi:hypothetical protein